MPALIILCAKYLIIVSVLLALYSLYAVPPESRVRRTIIVIVSLALTYALGKLAAHFYFDPRPFVIQNVQPLIPHAADNGFPSDHALLAAGLAAAALFYNRRVALWLWIIAIAIGAARVLAFVHHPVDIVGSMVLALLGAWFANHAARRFFF